MVELLIVGCGPAGLTAGIYSARYGVECELLGKDYGLLGEAHQVENYPGFSSIGGLELAERMLSQLKGYGVQVRLGVEVLRIRREGGGFKAELAEGETLSSRAVIYAAGSRHRRLEIPGEAEFQGRGVSYCAVCDAPLYRGKTVVVIGGRNSAAQSALLLSQHASKVFIAYRGSKLRCDPILAERVEGNPRIEVLYEVTPVRFLGGKVLEAVEFKRETGESFQLKVDGVFVEIGTVPNVEPVKGLGVELDEDGRIRVKADMSTSVEGLSLIHI